MINTDGFALTVVKIAELLTSVGSFKLYSKIFVITKYWSITKKFVCMELKFKSF